MANNVLNLNRCRRFRQSALTCCLLLVTCYLAGCGYTLQTTADLPFDTISIGRIDNKTLEPKLQDRFNRSLAEYLAQYGYQVGPSRYILEGEITGFTLMPTTEQNLVATQYQIVITANFKLTDKTNGRSVPLIASTPFITYFGSSGSLVNVLAQKESATAGALQNLSLSVVTQITYNISQNFAYLSFNSSDLRDPRDLLLKLQEPKDPVSLYIRKQLSYDARRMVDEYDPFEQPSDTLKNTLAGELNTILQKPSFYDEERFAQAPLTGEIRKLISRNPKGAERTRLNRLLLEEAYPDVFVPLEAAAFLFTDKDLKDPGRLALKLQDAQDPLSRYLREQFSPAARRLVDTYGKSEKPSDQLRKALVSELNAQLQGPSLFEERRFAQVRLSEKTRELIGKNPKGSERIHLNRLLLEDAYPGEIERRQINPEAVPPSEKSGR